MERGIRNNEGKPRWSLVDFKALEPMVAVLEKGGKEVGDDNWKKGLLTKEVCESLMRHLIAYLDNEDLDQKSGLPHVGHILSNAMFLSHMFLFRKDMDNRQPKPEFGISPEDMLRGEIRKGVLDGIAKNSIAIFD